MRKIQVTDFVALAFILFVHLSQTDKHCLLSSWNLWPAPDVIVTSNFFEFTFSNNTLVHIIGFNVLCLVGHYFTHITLTK